jgi:hypothetical protein
MHDGRGKKHQAYLWQYSRPGAVVSSTFEWVANEKDQTVLGQLRGPPPKGSFQSLRELVRSIESFLAERNQNPKKYVWRATGLKILEKIQRAKQALVAAQINII